MKFLPGLFLGLACCLGLAAQTRACDLTLKDAPIIRGLQLGMERAAAVSVVPQAPNAVLPEGGNVITITPKNTKEIAAIQVSFFEDRLYKYEVNYQTGKIKWKDAQEFATSLSTTLDFPFQHWVFDDSNPSTSEAKCREFSVKINSSLNKITITDSIAERQLKKETETPVKPLPIPNF